MHDCEAACDRIGIMVDGRLACLGILQNLRARFGTGYSIKLKLKKSERKAEEKEEEILKAVKEEIPSTTFEGILQVIYAHGRCATRFV